MTVFAFGSAKASPGVTTAVLALAAVWPASREVLIAELDPDGGDLACRFGLPSEPGMLSLAAQGRRDLTGATLFGHTQPLPGLERVHVLAGPTSAEQSRAALSTLLGSGLRWCLTDLVDVDVLLDCGRLVPGSLALDLLSQVDATVLVARPTLAESAHLQARVAALRDCRPVVLLVGDRPYPPAEVGQAIDAPIVGVLAEDPRGAAMLAAPVVSRLSRCPLLRSAVQVAERLAGLAGDEPEAVDIAVGQWV